MRIDEKISEPPPLQEKISEPPPLQEKISEAPPLREKISEAPPLQEKISEAPALQEKITEEDRAVSDDDSDMSELQRMVAAARCEVDSAGSSEGDASKKSVSRSLEPSLEAEKDEAKKVSLVANTGMAAFCMIYIYIYISGSFSAEACPGARNGCVAVHCGWIDGPGD